MPAHEQLDVTLPLEHARRRLHQAQEAAAYLEESAGWTSVLGCLQGDITIALEKITAALAAAGHPTP